jgi:hypothetical protein
MASGRRRADRLGTVWPSGRKFQKRDRHCRLWRIGQRNTYFMAKFLCHGNNRGLLAINRKRWKPQMFMLGRGLGMHLSLAMHVNLALNRDAMGVRVEQRREALQKRKKKQDKKAAAARSHGADIKPSLNHKQLISCFRDHSPHTKSHRGLIRFPWLSQSAAGP